MNRTVLFVDDDRNQLEAMVRGVRCSDFEALAAENLDHANYLLQTHPIDAIVSDELMPGVSGTMFLSSVAAHYPDVIRILLTGQPSLQVATEAINRAQVSYFLTKPFELIDLMKILDKAINERIRARDALRRAQKMSTLGQFTSGIVHNVNNMLAVIVGNSELILKDMDTQVSWRDSIKQICDAGNRATDLIRQLLAFSRDEKPQAVVFCPNQVIADIEKLLVHLIGKQVKIETVLDPDVPNVRTNPHQLEQALLNLALNARDAMLEGGKLTIKTSHSVAAAPAMKKEKKQARRHRYVVISVTDTGCGIPESIQEQIFEPFFTTKEQNKGTGLGLAMINDFIKNAGGSINVRSTPGEGSTFTLSIPAVP